MKILEYLARFIVGVLFIISGFIKANDALGFAYKLDEYFLVFHTPFLSAISLYLAMFICVLEIALGVATLIGYRMNLVSWLLLILIVFFTFLTFYSAYFNVVKDCGCFGDAIKLTPWGSFKKDIFLLVFILIIFIRRHKIKAILSDSNGRLVYYSAIVLSSVFTIYTYRYLPIIDFRPFAPGKSIIEGMSIPDDAPRDSVVMYFIYEKDGQQFEFTVDQLPEDLDQYTFVDRKDKVLKEGYKPPITDFSINDFEGTSYTEEFLNKEGYVFILVAYDLEKTNLDVQSEINAFADIALKEGHSFIGLTSTSPDRTEELRHELSNPFQYYFCDGTVLKTMIRSNPGLILMKGGTIITYWPYTRLPLYGEVKNNILK
ncbi:MAG TPA: DoxX family protein [Bacteroidia bacterium]|nr:DoxX family protein [Bacteroidia bacterium]HNT80352.1 DoxX family protein [Bacteroidia bacterium]